LLYALRKNPDAMSLGCEAFRYVRMSVVPRGEA
jgi:hypothetical protein